MTEIDVPAIVARIHAAPTRLVLAITGGGSRAIGELLEVPGGSRTLLEAVVPYSAAAMRDWLGAAPEHFCSARTARAMAMAAFLWARDLANDKPSSEDVVSEGHSTLQALAGVGCTASLASDRAKRGAHRIHGAWQSGSATVTHSVELVKGRRNRLEEEQVAARLVLMAIAEASGLSDRLPLNTHADESLATTRTEAPPAWQNLLARASRAVRHEDGAVACFASDLAIPSSGRRALFPGAFNPRHEGHCRMAELAAKLLGLPVEFEISIENVDKPPLDFTEMDERLRQFTTGQTVWFTRAPTFDRKSELFPNSTFLVGADTIRRIADPQYCPGDPRAAAAAIDRIAKRGGRFLVFGRLGNNGFESVSQLNLPNALRQICTEVPAEQFRHDISSTALRAECRISRDE